jgi:hypothetical protein
VRGVGIESGHSEYPISDILAEAHLIPRAGITTGKPWCRQISAGTEDNKTIRVEFSSTKPIDQAVLTSTTDTGFIGNRTWSDTPAKLSQTDAKVTATAPPPPRHHRLVHQSPQRQPHRQLRFLRDSIAVNPGQP